MKTAMQKLIHCCSKLWIIIIVIVVFVIGYWFGATFSSSRSGVESAVDHQRELESKKQIWTCSMHPQIRLPKPGLCPICNMSLISASVDDTDEMSDARQLTVSESARKLMDIETSPVERRFVTAKVRMVGKVDYDETRLAYITAWIPGRLDRLFVDYTGVPVQKGDHMVYLYSPELLVAQEELIQAIKAVKNVQETQLNIMRETAESTVKATREKLRLWGLTSEQIANIEKTGEAADHMTIYAPAGGIVIHKNALEGMYVKEGTRIYTIADLSQVWVKLDAYESDLQWLRYGQEMEFTTVSYPGEVFTGTIAFIDPVLNEKTRTVKIRVNVPNADGRLKPEMFVKAVVLAQVAGGGRIMDASLAGKWMCPMHPDIVKDSSDKCDICEMPLVQTEMLGYVSDDPALAEKPLAIPVTAVLITGTRAIVYVEVPDTEKPTFEGREIVLGPRAGDYYLVHSGLAQGDRVVVKGNFKIDSALQIMAKPSMMMPKDKPHNDHVEAVSSPISKSFSDQLGKVFERYFAIQQSLSDDDQDTVSAASVELLTALKAVDMKLVTGEDHDLWMKGSMDIQTILENMSKAIDIKSQREYFHQLSQHIIILARHFGTPGANPSYIMHCPMAFDNRGAHWLQNNDQTRNPYFGKMMLRCGGVTEVVPATVIKHKKDN